MARVARRGCLAVILLTFGGAGVPASAQPTPPAWKADYRFIASRSVLDEHHVGTEQPDFPYQVFGTFSLEYRGVDDDPWIGRSAAFVDVQAFFHYPFSAAPPRSLDDVLNLSGLTGHQLPIAAPYDAFQFTGKTKSGSDVSLRANVLGPWLTLRGGTTLPAGQIVGVEYVIDAVARTRPFADFNDDGVVDRFDLPRLTTGFGLGPYPGDVTSSGDADGDGDVDGADFLAWQNRLGERAPATFPLATAVAEPASSAPAALAMAGVLCGCRRPRGRRSKDAAGC